MSKKNAQTPLPVKGLMKAGVKPKCDREVPWSIAGVAIAIPASPQALPMGTAKFIIKATLPLSEGFDSLTYVQV